MLFSSPVSTPPYWDHHSVAPIIGTFKVETSVADSTGVCSWLACRMGLHQGNVGSVKGTAGASLVQAWLVPNGAGSCTAGVCQENAIKVVGELGSVPE